MQKRPNGEDPRKYSENPLQAARENKQVTLGNPDTQKMKTRGLFCFFVAYFPSWLISFLVAYFYLAHLKSALDWTRVQRFLTICDIPGSRFLVAYFYFGAPSISGAWLARHVSVAYFYFPSLIFPVAYLLFYNFPTL